MTADPKEARRLPLVAPEGVRRECGSWVGLPGSELFKRGERGAEGAWGAASLPAFASVSRNSTHNREND